MKPLYHYTTGVYAPLILADGAILPSKRRTLEAGEIPLVWCSFHPIWEPTAAKGLGAREQATGEITLIRTLTLEEHERATSGVVRFEVNPSAAPMEWEYACNYAGTSRAMVEFMEKRALDLGADKWDWRASAKAITMRDWIGLEEYDFGRKEWIRLMWFAASFSPTLDHMEAV